MFAKTYYAAHPDMMVGAGNADPHDRHAVPGLFRPGEIVLTCSHGERSIIGGATPGAGPLLLPVQTEPASAAGHPLLERRELGLVNIGPGDGVVTVDGIPYPLAACDALYMPMGSREVMFTGAGDASTCTASPRTSPSRSAS